jgi:hypothetical protein
MTSLEQALAKILGSIEETKESGNSRALAVLLRRKQAICAALAAPEQSWHDPSERAADAVDRRKAA